MTGLSCAGITRMPDRLNFKDSYYFPYAISCTNQNTSVYYENIGYHKMSHRVKRDQTIDQIRKITEYEFTTDKDDILQNHFYLNIINENVFRVIFNPLQVFHNNFNYSANIETDKVDGETYRPLTQKEKMLSISNKMLEGGSFMSSKNISERDFN